VNGTLTTWNDLWNLHITYGIPTAAQMVFHAYDDIQGCQPPPPDHYYAQRMDAGSGSACMDATQMLYQAVNTASTYATQWQEIYELDILNLATPIMTHTSPSVFPATLLVMRISCSTPDPSSSEL